MCFQRITCVRNEGYVLDVVEMCMRVVRCAKTVMCMYVALKKAGVCRTSSWREKIGVRRLLLAPKPLVTNSHIQQETLSLA